MKKNYLSVLVILITIILVAHMIVNNKQEDMSYIMVENEKTETINERLLDNFIDDIEENYEQENNEIIREEITKKEDNNIPKDKKEDEKNTEEKEIIKNSIKENKDIDTNKEEMQSVKVFKVEKDLIMDMLTFKEKKYLTKIVRALSMSDYALIIESIKNDNELDCIIKINTILEERLDKQEYNLVKEIVEPFINLEIL